MALEPIKAKNHKITLSGRWRQQTLVRPGKDWLTNKISSYGRRSLVPPPLIGIRSFFLNFFRWFIFTTVCQWSGGLQSWNAVNAPCLPSSCHQECCSSVWAGPVWDGTLLKRKDRKTFIEKVKLFALMYSEILGVGGTVNELNQIGQLLILDGTNYKIWPKKLTNLGLKRLHTVIEVCMRLWPFLF